MSTDSPAPKATTETAPRRWGWARALLIMALGAMMVFLVVLFGGPILSGLYNDYFGDDSVVAIEGRTCVAPKGFTLSEFDESGRLVWQDSLIGMGGYVTGIVCDGTIPRPFAVKGLVLGDDTENQGGYATTPDRRMVTEWRLITTATDWETLDELGLPGRCVEMWQGACDPA